MAKSAYWSLSRSSKMVKMKKILKRLFLKRVKNLENVRKETLIRTKNAVSHSGMSVFLRKLAQKNSVTFVRNIEEFIQPIRDCKKY